MNRLLRSEKQRDGVPINQSRQIYTKEAPKNGTISTNHPRRRDTKTPDTAILARKRAEQTEIETP